MTEYGSAIKDGGVASRLHEPTMRVELGFTWQNKTNLTVRESYSLRCYLTNIESIPSNDLGEAFLEVVPLTHAMIVYPITSRLVDKHSMP